MPVVLMWGADLVDVPRPSMTTGEEETRLTLARYNGDDEEGRAQNYGTAMLGLHRVFEKDNAPLRGL
ncbi:hypothetical protein DF268_06225 [Streptomyces sp. V2]|uniref:Uncharacterized protein n=1 Tax=Streptomyces niveiscabiei TaxID=164115 RepID=A0ABW9HHA4_9ACTN|nr:MULTISPECIES: hypothetical protein [Streptomyces]PWG14471.1 hypothetical protein DF268_06225 [Streptomyces sp. V2]